MNDGRIVTDVSTSVRVPGPPATRAFAVVGAGMVVLILIDVVVGERVFERGAPGADRRRVRRVRALLRDARTAPAPARRDDRWRAGQHRRVPRGRRVGTARTSCR